MPITVVAVVAFADSAAAAVAAATLGECCNEFCILCHDIRYLLALFREGFLEKREGIEGRWYGCARGGIQNVFFPSRCE